MSFVYDSFLMIAAHLRTDRTGAQATFRQKDCQLKTGLAFDCTFSACPQETPQTVFLLIER